jgi:hypothetical protein
MHAMSAPAQRRTALTVDISASAAGWDSDGNPIPTGATIAVEALAIAPGNTSLTINTGELDEADYTVYLPLGSPITDDDLMTVRGKVCNTRVKEWRSPWTGRGGLEVLCSAITGSSA